MKKILLLVVALFGAGFLEAITWNWLKITNLSQFPVRITVSYKGSSQAACGEDEQFLSVGQDFVFDKMGGCQIDNIRADQVERVTENGQTYWKVVRTNLRTLSGHRYKRTFEFVGPDKDGKFSFEQCPKFCNGQVRFVEQK